jgi:L-2-hydroxyglutarate oxidase
MTRPSSDVVVVGGGILGLATAWALVQRLPGASVTVLEKEQELATHQTGRNSGVIHSGIYYAPGSLKARLAVEGADRMLEFCAEHDVAHDRCGKLVVAVDGAEVARLRDLAERAGANGVAVEELTPGAAADHEPHIRCTAALHVPSTGRADFGAVARRLADLVIEAGGSVRTGVRVTGGSPTADGWELATDTGPVSGRFLVGCAGLQGDRLARRTGSEPGARIVPFRGEYLDVVGPSAGLVRGLVYPVPDPRFPFLGVHLTRGLDDRVHAGPNAVLALAREGYGRGAVSLRDLFETLTWPGTARLVGRYWRPGLDELLRSLSRKRFAQAARRLVPDLDPADFRRAPSGIRAQALDRRGALLDDFHMVDGDRSVHVVNAPSPAATASLAIGDVIAERVAGRISGT